MAIVSVELKWDGESSDYDVSEDGQEVTAQHVDVYTVVAEGSDTTQTILGDTTNIPQPRSVHPNNPYLFAFQISAVRTGPISFEVTVGYRAFSFGGEPGGGNGEPTNPTLEPAKIRYRTIKTDVLIDEDVNGKPIQNTVGQSLAGVRRPASDIALEVSKNFKFFRPNVFWEFVDRVNSAAFHGFPAGTAFVDSLTAQPVIQNDFAYWEVTVIVVFKNPVRTSKSRAWWARVLNEGTLYKTTAGANTLTDTPGRQKRMLKQDGTLVTGADDPYWQEFQILDTTDLNQMGFNI